MLQMQDILAVSTPQREFQPKANLDVRQQLPKIVGQRHIHVVRYSGKMGQGGPEQEP